MPAPKGNKYALGNKGGRPRLFEAVDELAPLIDEYFEVCDRNIHIVQKEGKEGKIWEYGFNKPLPYTLEGLCNYIGMTTKTFREYAKQKEFCFITKMAYQKIRENRIVGGLEGTQNALIVKLDLVSNHGYTDRREHTVKTPDTPLADELKKLRENGKKNKA